MERTYIKDLRESVGKNVSICGWVDTRRDHGKLVFIDLRDSSGKTQVVFLPNHESVESISQELRSEWLVEITGVVNKRPEKMVNASEMNGDIEVEATDIKVLSRSKTPPFDVTSDTSNIDEELRLSHRYLDLRTERMQRNLKIRSEFVRKMREHLFGKGFLEIETPMLTESTPEGSRDFVVPSRIKPGNFYALPQSPQQYKQLLMVSGFEKYFQIARCLRDEDLRADRGFEHTQVDIEMSFVDMEKVMNVVEEMIIDVVERMGYSVKEKPFPRVSHKEAIEKYGADKFDLRNEEEKKNGVLAYAWVTNFPFFEKNDNGGWTFTHNPFSMPIEEHKEWLLTGKNIGEILTTQYDLVCNGFESGGGSVRAHDPEILKATYKIMGFSEDETNERIGHMLEAFSYGTPPHGGIALGVERNIMNLTGEGELREVQAFPMTRKGQTSVMKAPKPLEKDQLKELKIKIDGSH